MKLDTAIQEMLFKSSDCEIEDIAYLARTDREDIISRYQHAYNWSIADCAEFLDNATLAYELLIKDKAA